MNADPLMAAVTPQIGQAFTAATGTFTEVPDSLRQTTEVSLTAEIYSQAAAAFGLNPFTGHGRPGSDVQRRGSGGPSTYCWELRK